MRGRGEKVKGGEGVKAPTRPRTRPPLPARIVLSLLLLSSLSPFPPFASPPFQTPAAAASDATISTDTRDGRLAVFDEVWAAIAERYYDPKLRGVDWEAQRECWRPLAAAAAGRAEFYSILRRMIGSLRDAHTRVFAPEERTEWHRPVYTSVGLSLREIEGELLVTQVERGSDAERAGLRAGDALLTIDGQHAGELLSRRLAEVPAAPQSPSARLGATSRLFDGPRDSTVELRFADSRDTTRTKLVRLRRSLRTRSPALTVRRDEGAAVVSFNFFTQEIAVELMRSLRERKELRSARGLVVDLRENGGGDAEAMIDIASAFLPVGTSLGEFRDRGGEVAAAPLTRRAMLLAADAVANFRGPVVVLTGPRTASAAEIFAAALQERGRARVLGEQTCGCVLAIRRRHLLPDGGLLDISEMDYRTAGARRLEGAGVTPDELVGPTRRDIEQGRDPALALALARLKSAKEK